MIRWFFILSWFVLLYFLVDSKEQIRQLEGQVAIQDALAAKRNPLPPTTRVVRNLKENKTRSKLFEYLYLINQNGKKIRYRPNTLIVEDLSLAKDDRFLDLLDLLYEQEKLHRIEIPKNREIREDLRIAGFGDDFVGFSSDGVWRVLLR